MDGAHYAYGEGTSFAAPIVSGLAALAWQAEPRLASEQVAEVMTRSAERYGWNQFTGAGVVDGMAAVELARVATTWSARASRGRARRHGNRVRATGQRARRTARARATSSPAESLLAARLARRRPGASASWRAAAARPFTRNVRLRGRRVNVLLATACDGNGNCGIKRLGRFMRRPTG